MRIVTFGAGYVGLVTGTGLADLGHEVQGVDIDPARVTALTSGETPIYEPGLAEILRRNLRGGRLQFVATVTPPFDEADMYFICVGTPPTETGAADVSAVFAVAETIAKVAKRPALVVVKSTVPIGTCDKVQAVLAGAKVRLEVVSNPEFLKEGTAVQDFLRPERIVVGARSDGARAAMHKLYAPLQIIGERMVMTDPISSELIKYAANTMLAMRVSFMNEVSRLCHATGANINDIRKGIGSDSRIGPKFLYAGPGYGGSCFPKDVQALTALGEERGVHMRLAEATHLANDDQRRFVLGLVLDALGPQPAGKRVALWGLAFKPETDDVREAPALHLAEGLLKNGVVVVGHDPEAGPNFARATGGRVTVVDRDYDALDGAGALVLLTEWRSYRGASFTEIRRRMRSPEGGAPAVIDARNVWPAAEVREAGLRYQGIGVPG